MNERIKTLAKVAGYDEINKAAMKLMGFDPEKFAELIVKECARIVDEPYDFKTPTNQRTYRYPLSGGTVLEHFGVEE